MLSINSLTQAFAITQDATGVLIEFRQDPITFVGADLILHLGNLTIAQLNDTVFL
jgi:hypothetical protein